MHCVATAETLMATPEGGVIEPGLDALLDAQSGPVTLMLHGFKYCPFHVPSARDPVLRDPRQLIYADVPASDCVRVASWPRLLDRAGPTIGISWPGMHAGSGDWAALRGFAEVYDRAGLVARQVARLADMIAARDPSRRIDFVGHSLGGRVALAALPHLMRAEPGRVLLWGAAERAEVARRHAAEAPGRTGIVNVRARTNARFDTMFEMCAPGRGPALGRSEPVAGLVDLTLDDPVTEAALAQRGITLARAPRGKCHWSFYTRKGTGALYREILDRPGIWTDERIAALAQVETPPSRLPAMLAALFPANRMRGA